MRYPSPTSAARYRWKEVGDWAHFSHLGNIAAAACDLRSDEIVQGVQFLSSNAPAAFAVRADPQRRLTNTTLEMSHEQKLRDLIVQSDLRTSPQAFVPTTDEEVAIGPAILNASSDYERTMAVA